MQVAYKSATYTQGTRLLLTASRTASSINSSHYQIQSPSSAHHPRKMKCCLAHKWSIRLSILFSECEERTRERGKLVDQKHDKPLPSVHRLTEGKGTSRFWNGNPSAHLRRRGFPDKRPYQAHCHPQWLLSGKPVLEEKPRGHESRKPLPDVR